MKKVVREQIRRLVRAQQTYTHDFTPRGTWRLDDREFDRPVNRCRSFVVISSTSLTEPSLYSWIYLGSAGGLNKIAPPSTSISPIPTMSVIPTPNPFIHGFLPPQDESPHERVIREQEEARAKVASDAIDEQIKLDRVAFRRYQRAIKLLLLGQSESGQLASPQASCLVHY
jgi:hypothetical protein